MLGASLEAAGHRPAAGDAAAHRWFRRLRLRHGLPELENLPSTTVDDLGLPDLVMLLATDIAAVDHHEGHYPPSSPTPSAGTAPTIRVHDAYDDAIGRLDTMTAALAAPAGLDRPWYDRPPGYTRAATL